MRSTTLVGTNRVVVILAAGLFFGCGTASKSPGGSMTGAGGSTGDGGSATHAGGAPSTSVSSSGGAGGAPSTSVSSSGGAGGASSSSSATTSASSSSSSTSSTSSSGSTAPPETCNGGVDICADPAPSGWDGPFQLYNGPSGQAPSCSGAASNQVLTAYLDPHGDPAQCTTCTVGAPHGQWCYAGVETFSDGACSDDPSVILFGLDYCNVLGDNDYTSISGVAAPAADYSCDVPDQNPTIPPLTWDTTAVGCAVPSPTTNGCSASRFCVPTPAAPFQPKLCISQAGEKTCPAQTYTEQSVFYLTANDGRGCTPCGYTTDPISCTATVVMYSDDACGNALVSVSDFSGACSGLPGAVGSTKLIGASFTGMPKCTPVGGEPTGMVAPGSPVTVCCTP